MTKALGKEGSFAEGRPIALSKDSLEKFWNISLPRVMVGGPRQRLFLKKLKFFCRGPAGKPSAKIFQKKKNNSLPRAVPLPSAKIFWKNSATFLCRGSWLEALGKDFSKKKNNSLPRVPGDSPRQRLRSRRRAVTAAFLYRVPVQPSAKALPSAR